MQPDVSVIVPIYGVEKYLRQCLDSIVNQTLKSLEIILVNDGSCDKCPQIIDEYAARDPRVKALHLTNGGYGRAINHGLDAATGRYIGIVESDDWIKEDMYQKLLENAEKTGADIVKSGFLNISVPRTVLKNISSRSIGCPNCNAPPGFSAFMTVLKFCSTIPASGHVCTNILS